MIDFTEYESVKNWLLSVSEGSRHNYRINMRKFLDRFRMNPDQLLEVAKRDRREVHQKLKEFHEQLRLEGLASKTCSVAYTAIRSFLAWNDYPLGRTPHAFKGKVLYEQNRLLEDHEIALMLLTARTTRDKALISFLAQSGQRVGIVSALRYRHVQHDLEHGIRPAIVNVNAEILGSKRRNVNKEGIVYRFAIGRESCRFLEMMMEERKEAGEPINGESWLFKTLSRLVGRDSKGRPMMRRVKESVPGLPISACAIRLRVVTVAGRAGIDRVIPGPRIHGIKTFCHEVHPHIFRRWWKFRMRRGGVTDSDLLNYMIGQSNVRLRHGGDYDEFDPFYIRREYAKAEPFLTVMNDTAPKIPVSTQATEATPELPVALSKNVTSPALMIAGRQRVVSEFELDSYLSQGWQYIATLPSGRIVVGG